MAYHFRLIGLTVLGLGALALYKTGVFRPVAKTVVATGMKVSDWAGEKKEKIKEEYQSIREEAAKECCACAEASTEVNTEINAELQEDTVKA